MTTIAAPDLAAMSSRDLIAEFAYATGEVVDKRHWRGTAAYEELVNGARLLRDELQRRLESEGQP